MRNPRILLYVAIVLAILNLARKAEPQQTLPLIHADFPVCVTIHPAPLGPHPTGKDPHPRMLDNA